MKKVAIIGGGKEGLSLLPMLRKSKDTTVVMIVDRNPNALIFKLNELGYKISADLNIEVTSNLSAIIHCKDLTLIIDASEDEETHLILRSFNLDNVEIISPLSARLIWGHMGESGAPQVSLVRSEKAGLLASLKEIVDAVNLTKDKKELLSMVLRVALSSTGSERGSIMLLDKEENRLSIVVSQGIPENIIKNFNGRSGEGIAGQVAETGKPILLSGRVNNSVLDELRGREAVQAALSVPLLADKKTIGVLNVSTNRSKDAFNDNDLTFLTTLASMGARIILRSQEIEEMRHDSDNFSIWKRVSNILNAVMSLEKKLFEVSNVISSYMRLECSIYTLEVDSSQLYLKASSNAGFSTSTYYTLMVGEGVEGIAAQTRGEVTLKGEVSEGDRVLFKVYPLLSSGGELQGVMRILSHSTKKEDPEDDSLLRDLIKIIAEEIKDSFKEERITLKATKISAINEAGINLISTKDLKEVTRLIASSAAMILEAEECVVRFLDPVSGHFTIMATYGMTDKESRISLFKQDKGLSHDVIEKGAAILVPHLKDSQYGSKESIARSGLCQPIKREGKIVGTISLYDKIVKGFFTPLPFNEEDKDILARFASYAEKAIDNSLIVEESMKLICFDELTTLPNAESMEKRLRDELERSRRNNKIFTFAFLDVPNFTSYVKVYGHDGGEVLVRNISHLLRERIRAFDVVGRFWGSRFGIILPESEEKGIDVIKRLMEEIEKTKLDPEGLFAPQKVKVIYGFTEYTGREADINELIKKAAEDLEKKKRAFLSE